MSQPAIAEVLLKLLNVEDSNFDHEFACQMKAKKAAIIPKIISKLIGKNTEEDFWVDDENLNACTIITQLLEVNNFFKVIRKPSFID
jgi:hypothetical protein